MGRRAGIAFRPFSFAGCGGLTPMNLGGNDTIAAIATPAGQGGVGIIRVSGSAVPAIIETLFGHSLSPRYAHLLAFRDAEGSVIDHGLALYFPAPHSFTGEHVLELHGHGSPVALDQVLRRLLELGARLARPGEFSERAFLNDKIDLVQAEAIADLIESASEQAARCAQRSLQGEFSLRIAHLLDRLTELRTYVEAAIDFVDEDIDFLARGSIAEKLRELVEQIDATERTARQGQVLRDGLTVVIAGPPNAGKSSLLNALAGRDTAIVTEVAGTTRDLLREFVLIDGIPLHVIDTAGLRDSDDPVEREGIRRAREALTQADRILLMSDDRDQTDLDRWLVGLPAHIPITRLRNKIDLSGRPPGFSQTDAGSEINLSVKTRAGMEELRQHLKACAGYDSEAGQIFIARRRHLDALTRAGSAIRSGLTQLELNQAPELLAEDLRHAQQALGEITGVYTTEDLLGRIFGSFCIGK